MTQIKQRERIRLDKAWRFRRDDISFEGDYWGWQKAGTCFQGAGRSRMDDADWELVDVPHDFVLGNGFAEPDPSKAKPHGIPEMWPGNTQSNEICHGCIPRGVGWYRKSFHIPAEDRGRTIYLVFDGVYRASTTYLNDFYIGDHMSGYTGFVYDITDFASCGEDNLLAMRVDARESEGWWYEGGGIYRHAWLLKTHPVHVKPHGLFAWPEFDPADSANAGVNVRIELRNNLDIDAHCEINIELIGPDGITAGTGQCGAHLALRDEADRELSIQVGNPRIWSLEDPCLYQAVATIRCDGEVVDRLAVQFGIRHAEFDADRGFFLNGKPMKLKGMCCHQDHAGVGVALPDALHDYRVKRLQEMGCNAYRTAHHPPTPELMDACDRLGMLVFPETRYFSSTKEHLAQLVDFVRIHRNHPSIICWGIGNEEQQAHTMPQGPKIARTMRHVLRQHDHSRPVTMAVAPYSWFIMDAMPLEPLMPLSDELDVMGFNYCECYWLSYHEQRPEKPVVVTEDTSCGVTRGCYRHDPERRYAAGLGLDGPNDDATINQRHWKIVAENDCVAGIFPWTGFDYRGEPCPFEEWPAVIANFGTMDLCGFRKDLFYYYKAQWTDKPMLHLFPHWNHPDMAGKKVPVYCHTNCDEVELFVNGEPAGRQALEKYGNLAWTDVVYQPGFIEAVGYIDGRQTACCRVETTGAAAALRIEPDRTFLAADGMDAAVINVSVVDDQGRVIPAATNEITFETEGAGRFLGAGNGDPCSHEHDWEPHRKAFAGLCQLIVQASNRPGTLTVTARSDDLAEATVRLPVDAPE